MEAAYEAIRRDCDLALQRVDAASRRPAHWWNAVPQALVSKALLLSTSWLLFSILRMCRESLAQQVEGYRTGKQQPPGCEEAAKQYDCLLPLISKIGEYRGRSLFMALPAAEARKCAKVLGQYMEDVAAASAAETILAALDGYEVDPSALPPLNGN